MEILAKFTDALSMFWQSLDDAERRMLVVGVAYAIGLVVVNRLEEGSRRRERAEIVQAVVEELQHG